MGYSLRVTRTVAGSGGGSKAFFLARVFWRVRSSRWITAGRWGAGALGTTGTVHGRRSDNDQASFQLSLFFFSGINTSTRGRSCIAARSPSRHRPRGCDELWLNPGTKSDAVLAEAERLGLDVIQACCLAAMGE